MQLGKCFYMFLITSYGQINNYNSINVTIILTTYERKTIFVEIMELQSAATMIDVLVH